MINPNVERTPDTPGHDDETVIETQPLRPTDEETYGTETTPIIVQPTDTG